MASPAKGLKAYQQRKQAEEDRRDQASRPRFNRFALKKDGDSAIVRFAQEVDPDAAHYSAKNDIGFVNIEHKGPDPQTGWMKRANCSIDSQGACFPCEKVTDSSVEWTDRKSWKQQEKFYINVVGGDPREEKEMKNGQEKSRFFTTDVDQTTGDGQVYLLEQGTYNGIWDALYEEAVENGTITENFFKIKRKGSGFNDTSYTLTKLKAVPAKAKDLEEFDVVNIEEGATKEVPYAQQQAYYYGGTAAATAQPVREPVGSSAGSSTSTDDGW